MRFETVDVRDVARAHILAMVHPQAAGRRFICAPHNISYLQLARSLAGEFDPLGYDVPTTKVSETDSPPLIHLFSSFFNVLKLLHSVQKLSCACCPTWMPRSK